MYPLKVYSLMNLENSNRKIKIYAIPTLYIVRDSL